MGRAAVAGVASDLAMPFEALFIDGEHHGHHLASNHLGLLVIFLGCTLDMAEVALYAERCGDELHGRNQFVRGQSLEDLDVLLWFEWLSGLAIGRPELKQGRQGRHTNSSANVS